MNQPTQTAAETARDIWQPLRDQRDAEIRQLRDAVRDCAARYTSTEYELHRIADDLDAVAKGGRMTKPRRA